MLLKILQLIFCVTPLVLSLILYKKPYRFMAKFHASWFKQEKVFEELRRQNIIFMEKSNHKLALKKRVLDIFSHLFV